MITLPCWCPYCGEPHSPAVRAESTPTKAVAEPAPFEVPEPIEKLRKRPVEVETMLWDGTAERFAEIQAWVWASPRPEREPHAFVKDYTGNVELYVAHNRDWCHMPVGYRVAKELDGSGFYPLSPEGAAAGYEMPGEGS